MEHAAFHKENVLSKSQKSKNAANYLKLHNLLDIDDFG